MIRRHVFRETLFAEFSGQGDPLGGCHPRESIALLRLDLAGEFAAHGSSMTSAVYRRQTCSGSNPAVTLYRLT